MAAEACTCERTPSGERSVWCFPCLNGKVRDARRELDPCHCSDVKGAHRHPLVLAPDKIAGAPRIPPSLLPSGGHPPGGASGTALFDVGDRGATLSPDGVYRYDLWRRWGAGPALGFVMLNPSTADATVDDPTITRCIGFARREGFAGLIVRNLFAFRATKPAELATAADPVGPEGDQWLAPDFAELIVCAWGAGTGITKLMRARAAAVLGALDPQRVRAFHPGGVAKPYPPHPLYLAVDTPLGAYP